MHPLLDGQHVCGKHAGAPVLRNSNTHCMRICWCAHVCTVLRAHSTRGRGTQRSLGHKVHRNAFVHIKCSHIQHVSYYVVLARSISHTNRHSVKCITHTLHSPLVYVVCFCMYLEAGPAAATIATCSKCGNETEELCRVSNNPGRQR